MVAMVNQNAGQAMTLHAAISALMTGTDLVALRPSGPLLMLTRFGRVMRIDKGKPHRWQPTAFDLVADDFAVVPLAALRSNQADAGAQPGAENQS